MNERMLADVRRGGARYSRNEESPVPLQRFGSSYPKSRRPENEESQAAASAKRLRRTVRDIHQKRSSDAGLIMAARRLADCAYFENKRRTPPMEVELP